MAEIVTLALETRRNAELVPISINGRKYTIP
jgi:hypothetical protein